MNEPATAPLKASAINVQTAASPLIASKEGADSNRIDLTIRVPADRWVDTGINICGCTNLNVTASGTWEYSLRASAHGILFATGSPINHPHASPERRDALTNNIPYGSLIARVGNSPFLFLGASRLVNGSQFSDSGTLKLGMNAGRTKLGAGALIVHITGTGDRDHEVRYCPFPR